MHVCYTVYEPKQITYRYLMQISSSRGENMLGVLFWENKWFEVSSEGVQRGFLSDSSRANDR